VMMPVLEGVTFVDRLRADARWAARVWTPS
jgi:hypothetical protein